MWLLLAPAASAAVVDSVDVTLGQPNHGVVVGTVDVPIREVVDIVLDCDGSDSWFPDLKDTRVVAHDGETVRCAGRTDLPWPMPDRTWEIDSHAEQVGPHAWSVPFALVAGSGNVDELKGRYLLEDLGDGRTRVTYEADVDIGIWIPDFVADWATRRVLPAILGGIEDTSAARPALVAEL